jgi:hypothetical protein
LGKVSENEEGIGLGYRHFSPKFLDLEGES